MYEFKVNTECVSMLKYKILCKIIFKATGFIDNRISRSMILNKSSVDYFVRRMNWQIYLHVYFSRLSIFSHAPFSGIWVIKRGRFGRKILGFPCDLSLQLHTIFQIVLYFLSWWRRINAMCTLQIELFWSKAPILSSK